MTSIPTSPGATGPSDCSYALNLSESQAAGDGSAGRVGGIVMDLDAVDARELEALADKSRAAIVASPRPVQ